MAKPDRPKVSFALAPGDLPTSRWLRSLKAKGVVVVDPIPWQHGIVKTGDIAHAILDGLGKSRDLNVLKRQPEPVALAWLMGLGAGASEVLEPAVGGPVVLVLEAQSLLEAETEGLLGWLEIAGLDAWLIFSTPEIAKAGLTPAEIRSGGVHGIVARSNEALRDAEPFDWGTFVAEMNERPKISRAKPLDDPPPSAPTWRVPRVDGLFFRTACQRSLSALEFAEVDELFVAQVKQFLASFEGLASGRKNEGVAEILRKAIEGAPSTEELIVTVRAAQVAALRFGYQMKVNTPRLLGAAEVLCRTGLFGPQRWWERLSAYQNPEPAAFATLWSAQIGPGTFSKLRISDLKSEPSGVKVTYGEEQSQQVMVDFPAAQFLITQCNYRVLCGAGPDDPLFSTFKGAGITAGGASRSLRLTTAELGIDLIEDTVAYAGRPPHVYLARYGITLHRLLRDIQLSARVPKQKKKARRK